MYFPADMTFQYFFFDTYPGYFLQALPFALLLGAAAARRRRRGGSSLRDSILPALFVSYLTGLLCLTLFLDLISILYYHLFYHAYSGITLRWFTFEFDLIPDLFHHFGTEAMGNLLLFLPFGLLYPFYRAGSSWGRTVRAGFLLSAAIELIQPVFGRSFDINDLILNTFGTVLSATLFFAGKALLHPHRGV